MSDVDRAIEKLRNSPREGELPRALFLCMGPGRAKDHSPLMRYWIITDDELRSGELALDEPGMESERIFCVDAKACRKLAMTSVGAVYEVRADPAQGRVQLATGRVGKQVGRWPVKAAVARWAALSAARERDDQAEDQARKDAKVDELRRHLEPVRRAYNEATGSQRAQLIALVVELVTRRTPL
ncbi:MAG TPA: hypothetical protein VK807_23405 [Gemmatimonadaceae bacterium]|jgi:hypothetical protein|nr:hypothetical protein [Gemmatimonadaceae bacterium]